MQDGIKNKTRRMELGRGDGPFILMSLALVIAFSFAVALMPIQLTALVLFLAWFIAFVLAVTHHPKS